MAREAFASILAGRPPSLRYSQTSAQPKRCGLCSRPRPLPYQTRRALLHRPSLGNPLVGDPRCSFSSTLDHIAVASTVKRLPQGASNHDFLDHMLVLGRVSHHGSLLPYKGTATKGLEYSRLSKEFRILKVRAGLFACDTHQ
jgi:hypothetical protein